MAGITKSPEIEKKIKRLADHTFHRLCEKYQNGTLQAGFEMFRNELIFQLKHEKLHFEDIK